MINVKMQHEALKIDLGDFSCPCPNVRTSYGVDYSCKYLKKFIEADDIKNLHPIPLVNFGWRGYCSWNILQEHLKVDVQDVKKHFEYDCPWGKNTYYRFYPDWILANNVNDYRDKNNHVDDFFYDGEWFKSQNMKCDGSAALYRQGYISKSMMGHGYTEVMFPSDGSGEKKIVGIELSNRDLLIGYGWIWYNK
jgi:hypothetical protein